MPPPPSPSDDPNFKELKRHEIFYISGADLTFLVGGVLIRVHRYFFDRESRVFREQVLPAAEGGSPHGYTDSTAITIDVPLEDFTKLLGIFYNPTYTLFDLKISDWTTILALAHTWEFTQVKHLAVRELQKHELDIVPRIALYQVYDAGPAALVPLYARLCVRAEPPSDEEAEALGIKTTVRVYRARELLRAVPAATGGPPGGSPLAALARDEVLKVVGEVFGMDTSAVDDTGSSGNKKGKQQPPKKKP